jgi:hypothetical protein
MKNRRSLGRWFLGSGCIGVIVALVLVATTIRTHHMFSVTVFLVLWPFSIAGIVDPTTWSDKIIVGTLEFGGNFILYRVIGLFIRLSTGSPGAG